MLTASTEVKGSAGYVSIERVTGTLNGRAGSFVLRHANAGRAGTERRRGAGFGHRPACGSCGKTDGAYRKRKTILRIRVHPPRRALMAVDKRKCRAGNACFKKKSAAWRVV